MLVPREFMKGSEILLLGEELLKEGVSFKQVISHKVDFLTTLVLTTIHCGELEIVLELNEGIVHWIKRFHKHVIDLVLLIDLDRVDTNDFGEE